MALSPVSPLACVQPGVALGESSMRVAVAKGSSGVILSRKTTTIMVKDRFREASIQHFIPECNYNPVLICSKRIVQRSTAKTIVRDPKTPSVPLRSSLARTSWFSNVITFLKKF